MKIAVNNYDNETVSLLEGTQASEFLQNVFRSDEDVETFLTEHRRQYFCDEPVNQHIVLNEQFFKTVTNLGLHVDGEMDIYFLK